MFTNEQCNESYSYKQYWTLTSVTSCLQTEDGYEMWLKCSQIEK
jgi:hypothetical protein